MRFFSLKISGLHSVVATAGLMLGVGMACNSDGDSNGGSCVSGQVSFCPCPGDAATTPSGMQTCLADGTFGACICGDTSASASGGETDDTANSNSESDDTTGDAPDLCGNGFPDPGECQIDPDGDMVFCPEDCNGDSDTDTDTAGPTDTDTSTESDTEGETESDTAVDVCAGVPIYVANVPNSTSVWEYMAFGPGFTSGVQACIAAGADGVCTYTQMVEANAQGDFAGTPAGTTFWVHRIVATMFNGAMIQPDVRTRCNDWTYSTNHIYDGEYATMGAAGIDFTLDADPTPNGQGDPSGLDCGGGPIRAIPCCNVCEG